MDGMTRRGVLQVGAAGLATAAVAGRAGAAPVVADKKFTQAKVEWTDSSDGDAVALRPGGGQEAKFAKFSNPKGLMIAVAAGLNGWTVDFTTNSDSGEFWENVRINAVHKK